MPPSPTRPRTTPQVLDALEVALNVLRDRQQRNSDPEVGLAVRYIEGLIAYKRQESSSDR